MTTKQRKRERQRLAKAAANRRNPSPNRPTTAVLSGLREASGTGILRTQRDEITTANACDNLAGGTYRVGGIWKKYFRTAVVDDVHWSETRHPIPGQELIAGLSDRT